MKRPLFALIIAILMGLIAVGASAQQGCVMPTVCPPDTICEIWCPPTGGVFTNPDWLKIDHHRVTVNIANQIAQTSVSLEFVNDGEGLAEGTFIFPLPAGASVDSLTMFINDQPVEARILEADEAREVYDAIVRSYRDPALLEYIGMSAVQANVFPIPPGETRRIELTYSQVLELDNGLLHYSYPLDVSRLTSRRPIETMSISVRVESNEPISTVYSPSHDIAVARDGDNAFRAGFEQSMFVPDQDFSLYYGVESDEISLNVLTYRESSNEDGFFMLLVQPPLEMDTENIPARDIILVLDQSGSMQGDKWAQAQSAAAYVLENLSPEDRFNAILFSTGVRTFSDQLEDASVAGEAVDWINGQFAEGGTNINDSLMTALDMVGERQTTILFMTDGLATEGEMDPDDILANLQAAAPGNARIFTFGVGDDVDTFLLDRISNSFHGASSYVRPNERIDEEVASLYNKISAPVLQNAMVEIDGVRVDSLYPEMPIDIFAGTQLTLVGRYRDGVEDATITLTGDVNGEQRSFVYDGFSFRERGGGESFISQLWATRRIGDMLNQIRLNGENPELVNSIVNLSVRYGIITPYTSFLLDENDILSQTGRAAAESEFFVAAQEMAESASGGFAVGAADMAANMAAAAAPMAMPTLTTDGDDAGMLFNGQQSPIQTVGGKTFILQNGIWTDTTFEPDTMETQAVEFLSDAYFDLLIAHPELGEYFALGEQVIVVLDDVAYEVTPAPTAE
ncbi:MAG: VWA domain-containing protein [Anaerolineae bacterium]|nr:VWA domain-containing protein [Anaerolineae bacterium]